MQTEERLRTELPGPRDQRSRWLIPALAGAAAVIIAIVVGALLLSGGSDEPDVIEPTPTTSATTLPEAAVDPAIEVVLAAAEARSRGDIDTYLATLTGQELSFEQNVGLAEALSYANASIDLSDCNVAEQTPAGESVVECQFTSTDDFYGAGGISDSGLISFQVTADGKISGSRTDDDAVRFEDTDVAQFNLAFWSWLMKTYPSVFEDIGHLNSLINVPGLTFSPSDPHDPAEMGIALGYVEEFVAQSDVYPLSP